MPEHGYRPFEEDEIDLIELVQNFWKERVTIFKITGIFIALGLLVALFSSVEYSAEATLIPETQSSQLGGSGLLQQYGGLLGISGSSAMGSEGVIPPQLYPDIVQSLPYQVELMNQPVYFSTLDTTMTLHQYFRDVYTPPVYTYIKKYTIGLPGLFINLFSSDQKQEGIEPIVEGVDVDAVVDLPAAQRSTMSLLRERLEIQQEDGLISFQVLFPDPHATAEIGQAGVTLLKDYVKQYRTKKSSEQLKFVREQVNEAKSRFEEAQQTLAEFRDNNVNLTTAKAQTRLQELQSQYELTFELYNSLRQRLEQAKMKVQEDTPVFTTVEPFYIPSNYSKPNVTLIFIVSIFLGLFFGVGYVLVNRWWDKSDITSNQINYNI